jgi:hypothetical protein
MSDTTQQIETVTIVSVEGTASTEGVSVLISYKGGNNRNTTMTAQEVLRQFGSYLTVADRKHLHNHGRHTHKHKTCTIL